MPRKVHLWAALALLPILLAGCDACGVPQEPLGTLELPASVAAGQPVTVGLAGTGWRAVTTEQCPTHVNVRVGNVAVDEVLVRVTRTTAGGRTECRLAVPASVAVTPHPTDVDAAGNVDVTVRYRRDDAGVIVTESAYLHGVVRVVSGGGTTTGTPPRPPAAPAAPAAPQPPAAGPVARFTVSPPPRTNRTTRLDASSSTAPAGIAAYAWDLDGDGAYETPSAGPVLEHVFTRRETVNAGLRVTAADGAVATTAQALAVEEPAAPVPAIAIASSDPGTRTVGFAGSATDPDEDPIASYTWDFGDGSPTEEGARVTHVFPGAGPYTVTLTVADASGMADTATVTARPEEPGAGAPAQAHAARAGAGRGQRAKRRPVALSTPFTLAVEGTSMQLGPIVRAPGRLRAPRVRAAGTASGALPRKVRKRAPAGVGVFASARWAGRFEVRAAGRLAALDPRRVSGTGTVLAVSVRSPRTSVCLRVTGAVAADQGTFTILGGTGSARRLHGTGGFGRTERLRVRTGAARPLPAACRALRTAAGRAGRAGRVR